MKFYRVPAVVTLISLLSIFQAGVLAAQPASGEIRRGPFYSGTIRGPESNRAIAMKGVVITVDENAYVCFDTDLMRLSLAWTGEFLEFGNTQTQIAWPPPPQVKGDPVFGTQPGPGWAQGKTLADPRPKAQGPLPKDWAHYEGLYLHEDQVVLSYAVGETKVLELPGYESGDNLNAFTRTFNVEPSKEPLTLAVCNFDAVPETKSPVSAKAVGEARYTTVGNTRRLAVGVVGGPDRVQFGVGEDRLRLQIPPQSEGTRLKVLISQVPDPESVGRFEALLEESSQPAALAELCRGGPAQWTETVVTQGRRGTGDEAYVVDTLTPPFNNPYNAQMFLGGFDFFPDGRAAVCTFHGDVWVVSGIDESLKELRWKRYATGMFQPLGLKIVDETVYVLGRDQITRLHDLNEDGEADYYENFNNDTIVTSNYHEFCLGLETDREGNFYFAKGAPWEPEVTSPHQGCLFKVSQDGSQLEVVATGLRAPNGMAVGPQDQITVSDNQGHWMPASKLNWVEPGGFYGMVPTAQRELQFHRDGSTFTANPSRPRERARHEFKAWNGEAPMPEGYDEPLCWLPMNMDNSSGGQVWVTSDQWGPMKEHLLFMSYGKCTLFEVMLDEVNGTRQAAMVQFPLRFDSGVMRGRFHPSDGQLYLCGLKGWQTSAIRNGGFYRVRYTGNPLRMPTAFHATKAGIEIRFGSPLAKSAADPENYSVERWNYRWSGNYGSPEFSVSNPDEKGHDQLKVAWVRLSGDDKTVFLKIGNMKPADQIKIRYNINTADGSRLSQEIYGTLHRLKAEGDKPQH